MPKRYIVRLSEEEQQYLKDLVSTGKAAAYKIKHANILLNIDVNGQGWTDEETATALYEAFPPAAARRLVERLEIHHTPKHGSWLNIAENELSALTRECLDRRIPDRETLEQETTV